MKHLLHLCLFLIAFSFGACEKENYQVQSEPLTPEERFDRMQKPLVLFQFAQRQLETGIERGWIIDREGWVRTYRKAFAPNTPPSVDHEILAEVELEYLYGSTLEGRFQLEKSELVEYLKQSVGLNQNQLSDPSVHAGENVVQSFFAYSQKTTQVPIGGMEGGCNNGEASYVNITQIHRSIIDMTGPQNRSNTSERGQVIHQWLLGLQAEIPLPELDQ